MKWKDIKKIDAHIHIVSNRKIEEIKNQKGNPYIEASVDNYLKQMDEFNIDKAVLMPMNSNYFYNDDPIDTNRFFGELVKKYPGKFYGFADIVNNGSNFMNDTPIILENAINVQGLHGLKIHPNNLHINADDLKLVPVLRKAAELNVPVLYHSNPCRTGYNDSCAPDRINKMIKVFPDLDIITAHLGGMKFMDAISGCTHVDISYILPVLVKMYDIQQTNRILRMFGPNRLIFGTDFPEGDLEEFCNILDQMDFTEEEKEMIAYKNILRILG